jgi:lactam utilization protein B
LAESEVIDKAREYGIDVQAEEFAGDGYTEKPLVLTPSSDGSAA